MNYKYDVSVILVNYNGKKYIDALFDSLCELVHDDFSFEVVFEDNASSDGSIEYLNQKEYSDKLNLRIVKSDENLGFAGGNNLGVDACEGKYIVLLNNDTKVDKYWLQNLYHFMLEHPEAVMVNSKLLFFYDFLPITFETRDKVLMDKMVELNGEDYLIDNKFCTNLLYEEDRLVCFGHSEINIPLKKGVTDYKLKIKLQQPMVEGDSILFGSEKVCQIGTTEIEINVTAEMVNNEKYSLVQNAGSGVNDTYDGYDIGFAKKDCEEYSKSYEINNGCGASIMMKKEDFINCGKFDEKFFMYYEDTDLSYRIKKKGGKILFCPDSIVRHIHTGSSTEWSPFFTYQVYRNKLLFVYKNISKKQFLKYYKIHKQQGVTEKNSYKTRGTKDALKIILGFKRVKF